MGHVHFNLAENHGDDEAPFAFLVTYATATQHTPLGLALLRFPDLRDEIITPVRHAAGTCPWLMDLVQSGQLLHPARWTPQEAKCLLADTPKLNEAGIIVRMPAGWGGKRPARPQATAIVGTRSPGPGRVGTDALLDFQVQVTLDGDDKPLTEREVQDLLAGADGLRLLRGRWVELDRDQLQEALQVIEQSAANGVSVADAMRMVTRRDDDPNHPALEEPSHPHVTPGAWLTETLATLRSPDGLSKVDLGDDLKAQLRPYQEIGARWLHRLTQLGLGACLADDMGLGKTMQIIALILAARRAADRGVEGPRAPHLLVAPASLLGNWTSELARFAPSVRPLVAHPSAMPAAEFAAARAPDLAEIDVVITSYGTLPRVSWLTQTRWGIAILDEAQAIKNPGTRQSRAVKVLNTRARVALTGTPIENRLGDLCSIFEFLNPGMLDPKSTVQEVREVVKPFILRRLKTDRSVITDLPDKTEMTAYCNLTGKQAALYKQAVDDLAEQLRRRNGIGRRGAVLASLLRLKQICNHPSQWTGDSDWCEADSGKFRRVREIAQEVAVRGEKLLVFTQFREACEPLAAFLAGVFGRPGLVLHGSTAVKERAERVRRFQNDAGIPFFVLSIKAGGTGLNLTAASHVLHFDRWWNPAIEDQATDRAFRIGQRRNVLVHKLVCRGTLEEKIDALIADKRALAQEILEGTSAIGVTEMADEELMKMVQFTPHV